MKFAAVTVFTAPCLLLLACTATPATESTGALGGDAEAMTSPDAASGHGESGLTDAGSDSNGTQPDAAGDAPPSLPPSSYDVARTFAGSYAGLIKFRKVISVGGSLGSFNALASVYSSIGITADPVKRVVTLAASECHMDITGTGTGALQGATLQIPDIVMTTTHLNPVTFSASSDGGAAEWNLTQLHGPIGWKWSSPSDATPTSGSDPRVFDQDMDGNPGVTMHVLWAGTDTPMSFVQTQRQTLSGRVAANGDLMGVTVDSSDQNIIGNTAALGGASVTWTSDPNTADNTARIVPLPAPLTCAELTAQASTLFP